MAGKSKVSGNISGNKLKISISTNNTGGGSTQPIESTANKVKSIAEVNAEQNKAQPTLNKKKVPQIDKGNAGQEVQLLKSIDQKLQDLNNNIIKIQTLSSSENKKESTNTKEPDKNIFDARFIEGTNNSFIALFNNSNFRTRLKTVLNEIYEDSPLLKASDLDSFKSEISEAISSSPYTIPNEEKAVDQEKYVNLSSETLKAMNQQAIESNAAMNSGSAKSIEEIGESIKTYTEKVEASTALNTETKDSQIKSINELLQERAATVKEEKSLTESTETNITSKAVENDNVEDKKETISIDEKIESSQKDIAKNEEKTEAENEEFNNQLNEKLDDLNDNLTENKEALDELIEERKKDKELRAIDREERAASREEKRKMMVEKTNKSNSIMNVIKSSLTKASSSIKNVGKSIALSKPISRMRSAFQKEPNKDPLQKKSSSIKIVEQKTVSRQGRNKEDGKGNIEPKRVDQIELSMKQKTVSGKDNLTSLRGVQKNSQSFLMGQGMKNSRSMNKNNGKSPLGELFKISAILTGFLSFYKRMAKNAEDRELFKLRFGTEKKSDEGMWDKLLNALKFKKDKKEKAKEKAPSSGSKWGWIGAAIGLVWAGLKMFGGKLGSLALKGLWSLTKLLGKGLWKLTTWIGKWALKGIGWALKQLGGLIGKLFKFLWGKVSSLFGKVFGKIGNILGKLGGKLIGAFKNVFGKVFGKAAQLISKIFGKLGGIFGKIFNGIFGKLGNIFGKFKGMFGKFGGVLKNLTGKVGQMAGKIGKAAKGLAKGAGKAAQGIAKNAGKIFKGAGKGIKSAGSFIGKIGKGIAKPFGKILSKGGGKAVAKVATKGLAKLGLKAGLRAGAGALKAIPGLGLIATAGMAAFDAVDGWKNAASIIGKKEKDLTWKDRTKAAGASVLSGLTFGLVSSQTMYKGINAVGDFAKKAWKYTPMGLAASGAKKAWNWLTKPSKTVDPKTGKVVEGKTGFQKIGDGAKAGLKAIGSIGKTLFKFTPAGMALTAAKGVVDLFKPKAKPLSFDQKQFTELKNLILGVKGTTALAAKKSDVSKFIGPIDKLKKSSAAISNKIADKLSKPVQATLLPSSIKPLTNASIKSIEKIKGIENKKIEISQREKEERKAKVDVANKKYDLMPQLITMGIASYFDSHKLRMDEKTGNIEVLPLGPADIASKV